MEISADLFEDYRWGAEGRNFTYHRKQIREFFCFRELTAKDTDMEVDRNYVDTHGQSVVTFAFCHLLGFILMPRFKNIGSQKLYRPEAVLNEEYPHLQHTLSRPVNWDLIRQQYEQIIKFATALRSGTASAESI